jgi:FlaA1/EpsC-like NDP-sugar epimerase
MRLLIFGGTGSLGHEIVTKYAGNEIWVASRDETKQWEMKMEYPTVNFRICDVRDASKVRQIIESISPDTIIIAAAMKHIDRCEDETHECIYTNIMGTKNILENLTIAVLRVCFVSTDKACSPVNVYGMCKGVSEGMIIERSLSDKTRKYVIVRYGNVLNSRGSIIPALHLTGQNPAKTSFLLTHPEMTRFIMTLSQSVDLIDHALEHAQSGDVVIPRLVSMKVKDLLEIFSDIYGKPVTTGSLRPGEKMLESLVNETQSRRLVVGSEYMYIKPRAMVDGAQVQDYNSSINSLSKEELREMLSILGLLNATPRSVLL